MLRCTLIVMCIFGLMSAVLPIAAHSGGFVKSHDDFDISAKKKKHRANVYVRSAPQSVYVVRRGWPDPSLAPDGRPYRNPYPPGTCTTDLGYGRFASCDSERK